MTKYIWSCILNRFKPLHISSSKHFIYCLMQEFRTHINFALFSFKLLYILLVMLSKQAYSCSFFRYTYVFINSVKINDWVLAAYLLFTFISFQTINIIVQQFTKMFPNRLMCLGFWYFHLLMDFSFCIFLGVRYILLF